MSVAGAHIVMTGANRGIGLALALHYAARGARLHALVRRSSAELAAVAASVVPDVEMRDPDSIARACDRLDVARIDLLLNIAGIMHWEELDGLDPDTVRLQFEVNALGPLLLTAALSEQLGPGSKVIFWTSRLGSMTDNRSGKGYGYRMSKAALNMAARTLAIDLEPRGIVVALLHPGSVKTSLNRLGGEIEVAEAVAGLTARIDELSIADTGTYRHQNGEPLPW